MIEGYHLVHSLALGGTVGEIPSMKSRDWDNFTA
jgi:hypothetical protein